MYQYIFSPNGFEFEEVGINSPKILDPRGREEIYADIRAGMFVGYIYTGKEFVQTWRKAYVLGMDRDNPENTIAIVQYPDGTISTFHSECDALAIWED